VIEDEKANWAKGMENANRHSADESAKRHHFEQELYNNQVEVANHRNSALQAERDVSKAANEIKARDAEIALYKSRESKTIVEHVHVLESAKKVTDRQLAEQVRENARLNMVMKSLETHRNRVVADLEDMTRQCDMLKASKSKEARSARASMSAEDKDATMAMEEERKARRLAEARVGSLEKDLQDQRRQLSTASLSSPSRNGNSYATDSRFAKMQSELTRLEQAHDATLAQNQRLKNELADVHRQTAPRTPKASDASRSELLRGLQQSHDALGRDMSDQLRKLEAQPLTPSRRHNSSLSNGHGAVQSPDLQAAKRIRTLETEISGLRQQLEDEREEKEFLQEQVMQMQDGRKANGKPPFPYEQAVYSHFRLKAKSLRSQLDQ
jgi:myosin protein heavy chain